MKRVLLPRASAQHPPDPGMRTRKKKKKGKRKKGGGGGGGLDEKKILLYFYDANSNSQCFCPLFRLTPGALDGKGEGGG